nr:MAG TPA: hypothetical protein [Caudoviricetes sp.]DAY35734.1 MAG TPA: hypothetical protein [Caudoviricetes sp.]
MSKGGPKIDHFRDFANMVFACNRLVVSRLQMSKAQPFR